MSYNHTFHWPAGPNEVIVTGTFDNWSSSLPLVKTSKGDFELTFPFKAEQQNEDKVLFKFVVDGAWVISKEYETIVDGGNENNVLYLDKLGAQSKSTGAKIPEAGGLASTVVIPQDTSVFEKENTDKGLNTTVLPSNEGNQVTTGEPGVVIPSNANDIKEFSEVRDVDAKALNEKLNASEGENFRTTVLPSNEGNQVTTGEPGAVIPSNANDIKEFSEVRDVDAKALNEKLNAEEAAPKKTQEVKVKKVIKRNKQTGEEIVISSEPVFDDEKTNGVKTLDPKQVDTTLSSDNTTSPAQTQPTSAGTAATTAETSTATPAKAETSAAATPKKPVAKKATPAKATPAKEEKKGFFRKIKKIFD